MENKPQNVFDKLDSIESLQKKTTFQNQQILEKIEKLISQQEIHQNKITKSNSQTKMPKEQVLRNFIKTSRKEYVWFGSLDDFNKSKKLVSIVALIHIIIGILATIITSCALRLYSTFTFVENLWLIFACSMFGYSKYAKKRIEDIELKNHSNIVFVKDIDGLWRNTNKEKNSFIVFRVLSYIAAVLNIICILTLPKGFISIIAILFELLFLGTNTCLFIIYFKFFHKYSGYVLFTRKNISNINSVVLVFDILRNIIIPFDECNGTTKNYLK